MQKSDQGYLSPFSRKKIKTDSRVKKQTLLIIFKLGLKKNKVDSKLYFQMHVSVICLIGICFGHGEDHDVEAEVELPSQKPPFDDGQVNAEVDLPADCRTPETWSNCSTWTCPGDYWELNLNANETTRKVDQKADFGGHKSDMIDQHQGKIVTLSTNNTFGRGTLPKLELSKWHSCIGLSPTKVA